MKKFTLLTFCLLLSGLFYGSVSAQFTTTPDTTAMLNVAYTYDANATGATAYALEVARPGMTIDEATGVISWTPDDHLSGGKVVITTNNDRSQTFFIHIASAYECLAGATSYWNFDETTGTTYEDVYGNHDAVATGTAPADIAGKVSRAKDIPKLNVTGMEVADHSDFHWGANESFSISFWVKSDVLDREGVFSNTGVIIGRNEGPTGNHWWIGLDPTNQITFLVRDPDATGGAGKATVPGSGYFYNNLNWHHVVCIRNAANNTLKIYFDGAAPAVPSATAAYSGAQAAFAATMPAPLSIGFLKPVGAEDNYPLTGSVDEMLIYDRALTLTEIQALFNRGNANNTACDPSAYAPVIVTEAVTTVDEDEDYSYVLTARDLDADALTIDLVTGPSWLETAINGNKITLSGTPDNSDVGTELVEVSVTDGLVTALQTFELEVVNVNDYPYITSTPASLVIDEDEEFTYNITYEDVDTDDEVTLTFVTLPDWIQTGTNSISGTPTNDDLGTEATMDFVVKLRVSDGTLDSTQTFVITVNNVNDAPVVLQQNDTLDTEVLIALPISLDILDFEDVDNIADDISLVVLEGTGYSVSDNEVTIAQTTDTSIFINVAVSDGVDSSEEFPLFVLINQPSAVRDLELIEASFYPNPSTSVVHFRIATSEIMNFELYDIAGALVYKDVTNNSGTFDLAVDKFNSGVYLYKFSNNKSVNTGKITIAR